MITALDISYASINPKRIGTIWIDENEYDYRIGIVAVGAELISDNQVYHIKEIKITPLYLAVSDKLPWIRIIIVDYIKDL